MCGLSEERKVPGLTRGAELALGRCECVRGTGEKRMQTLDICFKRSHPGGARKKI